MENYNYTRAKGNTESKSDRAADSLAVIAGEGIVSAIDLIFRCRPTAEKLSDGEFAELTEIIARQEEKIKNFIKANTE